MKIDVISGFLGAGKTTLIKKLLNGTLNKEKVAIIENEYGEVGIDGELLKSEEVEVKEITSGCICCSIKGDFKKSILNIIKDYRPERIIIEPSGVAKFSQVLESIREGKINGGRVNMRITVVDAQNVDMYIENFGEFYKDQILNASTILLSRTQNLLNDRLEHICNIIKSINKNCTLVTTPWDKISSERILEVGESTIEKLEEDINYKTTKNSLNESTIKMLENWGTETPKVFNINTVNIILKTLENDKTYGEVFRVKGIVNTYNNKWIKFDFVPNDIQITDYHSDYTGRICVIGKNLNKNKISKLFLGKEV